MKQIPHYSAETTETSASQIRRPFKYWIGKFIPYFSREQSATMAYLKGHNLGERHKYYNDLLKEVVTGKASNNIPKLNFDDDDVDNMMKIDMACHERNVEYILEVFKCADMLYVTRAIKKSTWLITEPQYADIINPMHLHCELFPQMNAKAITKLMLHIRRHLKDEIRVAEFYKYIYEKNPKDASKWLENCPLKFIEKVIAENTPKIPIKLLTRLCRKSISILRAFSTHDYFHENIFLYTKYFLKNKETCQEFLDIARCRLWGCQLNAKYTHIVMKNCPEKIKSNFAYYYQCMDLHTFVKYLRTDEIKPFMLSVESHIWNYEIMTPFLEKLRRDEVLNFLHILYKVELENNPDNDKSDVEAFFYAIANKSSWSLPVDVYPWYRFAPFDVAFRDIKKFIFAESDPRQRHSLLIILMTCANHDIENVKTVLQYYHDKHINEPYIHKKMFIDSLLSQHHTFRFDDNKWNILNTLFHSSEVYIESSNDVQACLIPIIVRDVLRDKTVHEVVEEKFEIDSFLNTKHELDSGEQDKLFNYLYNVVMKKINLQRTDSETGMRKAIKLLNSMWTLINDWGKAESHHQFVIDKISELGEIFRATDWIQEIEKNKCRNRKRKRQQYRNRRTRRRHTQPISSNYSIATDISSIYKMTNRYRKNLFEKSLVLHASEEVLLNALKHDPGLIERCKTEIDFLRISDKISLNRFLSKLRTYWPNSMALVWTEENKKLLEKPFGHRSLIRGLLTLMPQNKTLELIKMYAPSENKIDWNTANKIDLSITKHIAIHMHIARPQPSAEVVLWYAKGDYLQYALLSLRTMYYNLRSSELNEYINLLLKAPVSIQKHGIRLAFDRYDITKEKIKLASVLWNKTKNSSIRAILFTSMFELLCNEKVTEDIKATWTALSLFMNTLCDEENKNIYSTLTKVEQVPLCVVGEFYEKAYLFLRSLPEKSDMKHSVKCMLENAENIMEYLDPAFVEGTLLHSITDAFADRKDSLRLELLSVYLLYSKDLEIQMQKYNNLLRPLIDQMKPRWANGESYLLSGFDKFLEHICTKIRHLFELKRKMRIPVEILHNIRHALDKCPVYENYVLIRRWEITSKYLESLDKIIQFHQTNENINDDWESILSESLDQIAFLSLNFVMQDIRAYFPSIHVVFVTVLQKILNDFGIKRLNYLKVLYEMLQWKYCPAMYLLVIDMLNNDYCYTGQPELILWQNKVKQKINSHPSPEVTMYYFRKFDDKFPDSHNPPQVFNIFNYIK